MLLFKTLLLQFVAMEVVIGAMLHKYQYKKTASCYAFDPSRGVPLNEFVLTTGWYLECAAGGLFIMASLIAMAESIHNPPPKTGSTFSNVTPSEGKTNVSDK
jgi:hypothetical protein